MLQQVRDHKCFNCGNKWTKKVELSPHTQNISGEATAWCPECGKRAGSSSPIREVEEREFLTKSFISLLDPEALQRAKDILSQIHRKPTNETLLLALVSNLSHLLTTEEWVRASELWALYERTVSSDQRTVLTGASTESYS
jgi:DNA-directed RNA polymerase subunit RPC12/RpoP